MTHDRARAELSAWLDSGQSGELAGPLVEHLAGCVPCQQWLRAAEKVTTQVRQARNRTAPDRTEELLAAVLADQAQRDRARGRSRFLIRAGLTAAGAAQLAIIIPALVLGNAGGGTPVHASHELGAFNLALAVGFVMATIRPSLARGMLPVAGVASAALVVLAIVDSALGYTTPGAEAVHLITLAGAVLLYAAMRVERGRIRP